MNTQELTTLFAGCTPSSPLHEVAQDAIRRIAASTKVRIVDGRPQSSDDLLRIYTARLKRKHDRNERIPGLAETVQVFAECKGGLCAHYVEIESGLIYFWTDDDGKLVGCIL